MKHIICEEIPEGIDHLPNGAAIFEKDGKRQIHFLHGKEALVIPNSIYEAVWSGKPGDKLVVLKGDNSKVGMRYMGWPDK